MPGCRRTAVLLCSVCFSCATLAAEADQAVTLDRIRVKQSQLSTSYGSGDTTTAGKLPMPVMKTPQAVATVTEQMLLDFVPTSLDQALRSVSGVTQDNTVGGTTDSLTLRGFQPNEYFRNGIRAANVRVLTPGTETVEVLKGPSSLMYGAVEPGGLVNVVTKQPRFDGTFNDIRYQTSNRGADRWSLDSNGVLGKQVAGGELAGRLVLDRDRSDYWRNFGRNDNTFIAPSLAWRRGAFSSRLSYEYNKLDVPYDRGTVVVDDRIADLPPTRRLGERFEYLHETSELTELDMSYAFSPRTSLRVHGSYQDGRSTDLQMRPRRVTVNSQGQDVLIRRLDSNVGRHNGNRYISANLIHDLSTGPLGHQLLLGVDHERASERRAGTLQGPEETADTAMVLAAPVYGRLDPALMRPVANSGTDGDSRTTGAYLQDVVSIGEAWTAVLGGRYERFRSYQTAEGSSEPTDDSRGSTFLPRAGLVYQPRPWLSLYASYAESFQPNTYSASEFLPGSPTSFDPERGVSHEFGAKMELGGVRTSVAWFDIQKENVLVVENSVPRLMDQARSRGVEVDVAGDITPSLSVMAGYAYIESDDGEGHLLTNVPRNSFSASLRYGWEQGLLAGLSAGVSVQYVGERDGGANPGASPGGPEYFAMPDYTVADVFAAYQLPTLPVRLQLNVKNASDETYYASSGGSLRVNPGQARTVYLSASVHF
jgi:iron complex outermembrane receptor protein